MAQATFIILLSGASLGSQAVTLPAGFTEEIIPGPWDEPVGLTFEPDHQTSGGRAYVWERTGRVWIVEDDVKQTPP